MSATIPGRLVAPRHNLADDHPTLRGAWSQKPRVRAMLSRTSRSRDAQISGERADDDVGPCDASARGCLWRRQRRQHSHRRHRSRRRPRLDVLARCSRRRRSEPAIVVRVVRAHRRRHDLRSRPEHTGGVAVPTRRHRLSGNRVGDHRCVRPRVRIAVRDDRASAPQLRTASALARARRAQPGTA